MTKTAKMLLGFVLLLVILICGMLLSVVVRNARSPQMQEPTQNITPVQTETTPIPEKTVPQTTASETEPVQIPTPGEKKISGIVSILSENTFTEESFFYDHAGNILRHFTVGYQNGEQTYTIDKRYLYDYNGLLTQIKEANQSISQQEFHYEQGILTGYTYQEIMAKEIAYAVTSHYERDAHGDVVRITTTGSESDIWTIGEYDYDDLGRCISAYEQERYADHDFTRRITYDHSFNGSVIAETEETLFGSETTTRRILFGDPEQGYLYGPELADGYTVDSDVNGCITAVRDSAGQTVASLEYITLPNDALSESTDDSSRNPVPPETVTFGDLPSRFVFSSGAGAWGTYLTIAEDGNFTGEYHDSDMGDQGENYPNGTVYICNFEGKFTAPEKITDYIYTMELEYLTAEEPAGSVYYENGIRYVLSEPCGMENADTFYIYLPGADITELPEAFLSWTMIDRDIRDTLPSGYYGIFNEGGETGFVGAAETFVWYHEYLYHHQERRISLWPSYNGSSTLIFFPESGGAEMILEFPWNRDGQTEFRACDYEGGTGGYDIRLDFQEDLSAVTVSVTSIHGIDLSPWGGTTDGTLAVKFVAE